MKLNLDELKLLNQELGQMSAQERILWAWKHFGSGLIMTTSFGLQSAVMIHLVRQVSKEIPIVFVDTGYLFDDTYQYALTLQRELNFKAKIYSSSISPAYQKAAYGTLWEQGKEGMAKYNKLNKIEPMDRALDDLGATAWLAGLRNAQSDSRRSLSIVEKQSKILKIHPILDWEDMMTQQYLPQNKLSHHPLEGAGYESLGDWHSTKKLSEVEKSEDTRQGGYGRECGLHSDLSEDLDYNF